MLQIEQALVSVNKLENCRDVWPSAGSEALLRLALESMAQGIFMLDAHQRITVLNQRFLDLYGLPADIIKVGATAYDIVEQSVRVGNYHGMTAEAAWTRAAARLATKLPWRVEQRLSNGKVMAISYAPIPDGGWVTTHLDVTEKRNAEERLEYLATHDPLTGLGNRLLVQQILVHQIDAGVPFAVLCMDLDGFKQVNDSFGHAAGDELLGQVARRLIATAPADALVARLGGDEFLMQFSCQAPLEVGSSVAATIIDAIQKPFVVFGHVISVGVSLGIAIRPGDGATADDLIQNADKALYAAKHAGRGVFRCSGRDLPSTASRRRRLRDNGPTLPQATTPPQPEYRMPCEAARSPKPAELPALLDNQRQLGPTESGFVFNKLSSPISQKTRQSKVSVVR